MKKMTKIKFFFFISFLSQCSALLKLRGQKRRRRIFLLISADTGYKNNSHQNQDSLQGIIYSILSKKKKKNPLVSQRVRG